MTDEPDPVPATADPVGFSPEALAEPSEPLSKSRHEWAEENARLRAENAKLREALKECLREHGGFTIRGECEQKARAALGNDGSAPNPSEQTQERNGR